MIVEPSVRAYLESLRPAPDPVLAEMEAHAERDRIPVVEPLTGILLEVLATAARARRVAELGTAIGVSTLHLARALAPGGVVISFERDRARHDAARDYLRRAGVLDRVDLRLQDAASGLAGLEGPLDLVFLDATKVEYADYLDTALPMLGDGGIVVADNVLMGGAVAGRDGSGHWSGEAIAAARAVNERLIADERVAATVLPVGDGVAVAVRRTATS